MMKRKALKTAAAKPAARVVSKREGLRRRPGRPCHLCSHARLAEATADIAAGASLRVVGAKYGCTAPAVLKHIRRHMGAALLAQDLTRPVLDQLRNLQRRTDRLLAQAELAQDLPTALRGVHEARENLLGIARLTGEDKSAQRAEPTRIEVIYVDKQLVVQPASQPARIEGGNGGVA
jgi:hypothetical protein